MRIAVPTNDGTSISAHFGRSAAFLVYEIENGQIKSCELRTNAAQHSNAQSSCGDGSGQHQPHSHAEIVSSLSGCDVVICAGMGWRAAEALKSSGIAPVLASVPGSPEEAVSAYLKGELAGGNEGFCRCAH
jgi:predicted Fe-Mo cluster-binding NifX family protein